jgi:hypothetical protein
MCDLLFLITAFDRTLCYVAPRKAGVSTELLAYTNVSHRRNQSSVHCEVICWAGIAQSAKVVRLSALSRSLERWDNSGVCSQEMKLQPADKRDVRWFRAIHSSVSEIMSCC